MASSASLWGSSRALKARSCLMEIMEMELMEMELVEMELVEMELVEMELVEMELVEEVPQYLPASTYQKLCRGCHRSAPCSQHPAERRGSLPRGSLPRALPRGRLP